MPTLTDRQTQYQQEAAALQAQLDAIQTKADGDVARLQAQIDTVVAQAAAQATPIAKNLAEVQVELNLLAELLTDEVDNAATAAAAAPPVNATPAPDSPSSAEPATE